MADTSATFAEIDNKGLALRLHDNGDGTYSFQEHNATATLYASAARTAAPTLVDQTNEGAKGVHVVIDVTAVTADPSVVFTIEGKDPASGKYYTILASAAIVGTGTTVLRVFPGATAAANLTANDVIPKTWRVKCVHADTDSITYSVGASLVA